MATDFRRRMILEQSTKRQRFSHAPKLLPNQQVEVRSVEEGFQGSWHSGTVIECKTQIRVVKYNHIICDDNSANLVQFIPVLFAVDGIIPINWQPSNFPNYRGKIRPIPPRVFHDEFCYHYKQCVDAFHDNAWWEGVVFDHDDGYDERLVFFPDLGNELRVSFKNLRVTQDWDAASDEWKVRGDWIFLEIIEEFNVELLVFVSLKQIWDKLRMTKCFVNEMKEWTCPVKENWKETVKEVMVDNFNLKMSDFFHGLKQGHLFLDIKNRFLDSMVNLEDEFHVDVDLHSNLDTNLMIKSDYEDNNFEKNLSLEFDNTSETNIGDLKNEKHVVKKNETLRTNVVKSTSKRARKEVSPKYRTPRTVLSWLIDNNIVLPRAKVQYLHKKYGRVTREGIKCNCCNCIFSLSKFQSHVGPTNGRPSANILLEDGRSLLDCQLQLKLDQDSRSSKKKSRNRNEIGNDSDFICSVCQYGGELVLCDQCPSTFHISCVGLKEVPDGEWYCPSCCCRFCNQNIFSENQEHNMDSDILNCEQCERRYHIGCLKGKKDFLKLDSSYLEANRFCSLRCEEIYTGLQSLLGKSIPLGKDNLTWTLRKNKTFECSSYDSDMAESIENYSKLNVAISVMHECFEPVKENRTGRDIVEDVIFCRRSELRRLNFRGFYTVLLEKDDELISTAAVRVYGDKVAEVPLVGTRFQYRRRGMCHILMHQLEKKLREIGVQRLVLPAVSSLLHTWTKSFGFSVMTESEKLKLLGCTFLDFQGATMCHKFLVTNLPSTEPSTSRGNSCSTIKCYQRRKSKPVRVKVTFQK